jgi:hypothetical protein
VTYVALCSFAINFLSRTLWTSPAPLAYKACCFLSTDPASTETSLAAPWADPMFLASLPFRVPTVGEQIDDDENELNELAETTDEMRQRIVLEAAGWLAHRPGPALTLFECCYRRLFIGCCPDLTTEWIAALHNRLADMLVFLSFCFLGPSGLLVEKMPPLSFAERWLVMQAAFLRRGVADKALIEEVSVALCSNPGSALPLYLDLCAHVLSHMSPSQVPESLHSNPLTLSPKP